MQNTEHSQKETQDRFKTTRPKSMRPRPVLHETEAETKTNYCETETKKWSRDHAGLETLTSLQNKRVFLPVCHQ